MENRYIEYIHGGRPVQAGCAERRRAARRRTRCADLGRHSRNILLDEFDLGDEWRQRGGVAESGTEQDYRYAEKCFGRDRSIRIADGVS